jgi:hypothetical protein
MLVPGKDYYLDENGNIVFSKEYHLNRGYCCKNGCRHCPWSYGKNKDGRNVRSK